MNVAHYDKAINTIDGMIEIAKREQLIQGTYVDDKVDETLKIEGAICGGHKACLIGSAYIAYGRKIEAGDAYAWLDGVEPDERYTFLRRRPALRLAIDALDTEAMKRMEGKPRSTSASYGYTEDGRPIDEDPTYTGPKYEWANPSEEYFEETLKGSTNIHAEVADLCRAAKRRLQRERRKLLAAA